MSNKRRSLNRKKLRRRFKSIGEDGTSTSSVDAKTEKKPKRVDKHKSRKVPKKAICSSESIILQRKLLEIKALKERIDDLKDVIATRNAESTLNKSSIDFINSKIKKASNSCLSFLKCGNKLNMGFTSNGTEDSELQNHITWSDQKLEKPLLKRRGNNTISTIDGDFLKDNLHKEQQKFVEFDGVLIESDNSSRDEIETSNYNFSKLDSKMKCKEMPFRQDEILNNMDDQRYEQIRTYLQKIKKYKDLEKNLPEDEIDGVIKKGSKYKAKYENAIREEILEKYNLDITDSIYKGISAHEMRKSHEEIILNDEQAKTIDMAEDDDVDVPTSFFTLNQPVYKTKRDFEQPQAASKKINPHRITNNNTIVLPESYSMQPPPPMNNNEITHLNQKLETQASEIQEIKSTLRECVGMLKRNTNMKTIDTNKAYYPKYPINLEDFLHLHPFSAYEKLFNRRSLHNIIEAESIKNMIGKKVHERVDLETSCGCGCSATNIKYNSPVGRARTQHHHHHHHHRDEPQIREIYNHRNGPLQIEEVEVKNQNPMKYKATKDRGVKDKSASSIQIDCDDTDGFQETSSSILNNGKNRFWLIRFVRNKCCM